MSTWDEKAYAETLKAMHVLGADAAEPVGVRVAAWQREALLSDEAVERAAKAIDAVSVSFGAVSNWELHVEDARAALTAALGEDEQ